MNFMTSEMTKIRIRETQKIYSSEFGGKIDYIISQLQTWKEEGWEGIDVDHYYEDTNFELYKHRLETDEEYERRTNDFQKIEQKLKESRRKQYEQLKKEFEND